MSLLNHIEPVYRPPSEARSLILQVTNGCSWNRCTFCEMYTQPQKAFGFKPLEAIERELEHLPYVFARPEKVVPPRATLADEEHTSGHDLTRRSHMGSSNEPRPRCGESTGRDPAPLDPPLINAPN